MKSNQCGCVLMCSHSTFGGTFVVQNMKSISDKNLIYHQGLAKDIHFDKNKVPRKRPRNRKPIIDAEVTRRSTLSIRVFLKEFCVQFLENCYNTIMHAIKVRSFLYVLEVKLRSFSSVCAVKTRSFSSVRAVKVR